VSAAAWAEIALFIVAILICAPLGGKYLAAVYGGGKAPGDRVFGWVERPIYRFCRIDPEGEQRWTTYAYSLLAFSLVSVLVLYAQLRLQGHLPLNRWRWSAVSCGGGRAHSGASGSIWSARACACSCRWHSSVRSS
jgi:K+-transporting ATPase A subunit